MIFRQLFEHETSTFTYLLADEKTREAVLIDPVNVRVQQYLQLLEELDLKLIHALDTHVHADHVTALGDLRSLTQCRTYVGRKGSVACSDFSLEEGMLITFGEYALRVRFTPGHTDDSHCYVLEGGEAMVFTGDTLLIRGTGRTDFQNGSSEDLYHSLHEVLLKLPGETRVFPGHDYKGMSMSTIDEERVHNPRLQWDQSAFVKGMAELDLPNPKHIDVAVPANRQCGKVSELGK